MNLLWYYWPEILVNAAGAGAALYLRRRSGGGIRISWAILTGGLALNLLIALRAFLGWRPEVSWMIARGLGFAAAGCLVWIVMLDWLGRRARVQEFSPARRQITQAALYGAMGVPVAAAGYGMMIGRRQFRLVEVDLMIPELNPDLAGLKLVQLTDIHLGPYLSRAELRWCVDLANETRASFGLVTGDLVTGATEAIVPCLEELRRLKCSEAIFGCLGNHERYLEAEAYTAAEGSRRGIEFLRGARRELRVGGASINLVGMDFFYRDETHLRELNYLQRPGMLNVLLCHNPALFPKARREKWDLTVAGHTHGGQLDVEIFDRRLLPMRIATPYVYGQYREDNSVMYVSRGIGTVGVPARIGAPPEVALLRLRRA